MKLVIDLDDTCSYEESISAAIKESIEAEIGKEVRKLVRAAVDENKSAIIMVANTYAKRMVASKSDRLEELRYLRGLAENKNLPTLMRDTLRNAAAEIDRLHTALVAITNVPVGTVLTDHQMRTIAKNAIAT